MKPYFEEDGIVIYHGDCREVLPLLVKASCDFVGGSIDGAPECCDRCGKSYYDSVHQVSKLAEHSGAVHGREPARASRSIRDGQLGINHDVDALITDPPYGCGYAANPIVGKGKSQSNHAAQFWDSHAFNEIKIVLDFGKSQVIWGGNYYALPPSRGWLCWYKPDAPPSMAHCELAWTNRDGNTRLITHSIAATNGERLGHPTQKPEAVMRWTIQQAAPDAKSVLDPFCGSGTTLKAAKDLGLKAIGIEIEEKCCEIAAKRLSQKVLNFSGPS